MPDVWRGLQGAAVVLTQVALCGQAGLFQTMSWGDRHSPDGWEALGGCAGWPGSNVCLSAAHVVEKQCSGWSRAQALESSWLCLNPRSASEIQTALPSVLCDLGQAT